ncbi:MAG: DUF3078 domain-containing protein [Saprospiraceae bacterium]|nr:DUF3078 domain-containing protein [Candidatus Defluviibacterium haderslevense]
MKKLLVFLVLISWTCSLFGQTEAEKNRAAQEAERMKKMEASLKMDIKDGWTRKAAIGLDLGQLININPYVGAGSNRIGLGGAIGYTANLKKGQLGWKNGLLINLSTQRIGSGVLIAGNTEKPPFEKALDVLTLGSNIAYQFKSGSPWSFSLDFVLNSQLLASHLDSISKKTYLRNTQIAPYKTGLVSKFLSPATITIAPGIKYEKSKHWYAFLSPAAMKMIYINDKNIANLGVHGTDLKDENNVSLGYEQSKIGLGALGKLGYNNTFLKKLNVNSELTLFTDYLDNPQNIDVNWLNSIGVEILKGLNLNFRIDGFYDDNKNNSITNNDAVGGVLGTGKRTNIIEQLLITYNRNF